MIDRWFPTIKLALSFAQFKKLPRNPAYRYEYFENKAWLSPRPKQYSALLDLRPMEAAPTADLSGEPVRVRHLEAGDWDALPTSFAAAFGGVQPFESLGEKDCLQAATECLRHTRDGGDGPVIEPASFVAVSGEDGNTLGAALVTLMPDSDLTEFGGYRWKQPPPPDWMERRFGRPHLTWIFVSPFHARHGLGTTLLAAAVGALRVIGYRQLASTFLLGNESSTLWHWRNGFRLVAHPGSPRKMHERVRRSDPQET